MLALNFQSHSRWFWERDILYINIFCFCKLLRPFRHFIWFAFDVLFCQVSAWWRFNGEEFFVIDGVNEASFRVTLLSLNGTFLQWIWGWRELQDMKLLSVACWKEIFKLQGRETLQWNWFLNCYHLQEINDSKTLLIKYLNVRKLGHWNSWTSSSMWGIVC